MIDGRRRGGCGRSGPRSGLLQELLNQGFNGQVAFREKRPGVLKVLLPMFHEDGDMVDIFLEELPGNRLRLSDKGLTLMRLSSSHDIDTDNKERIFRLILEENRIQEEDGNLFLDVSLEQIYPAVLQLGQAVAKVCNMALYWSDHRNQTPNEVCT